MKKFEAYMKSNYRVPDFQLPGELEVITVIFPLYAVCTHPLTASTQCRLHIPYRDHAIPFSRDFNISLDLLGFFVAGFDRGTECLL
jgi:hypothetical protein